MKIGYAHVSTKDQDVALQVDALQKAGCGKVYTEIISSAVKERPVLKGVMIGQCLNRRIRLLSEPS